MITNDEYDDNYENNKRRNLQESASFLGGRSTYIISTASSPQNTGVYQNVNNASKIKRYLTPVVGVCQIECS